MLYGAPILLEVRSAAGATRLSGSFPYGVDTVLGDGRREMFSPGAFRRRVVSGERIYMLAGHDPEKPIASTEAGTLTLRDDDQALHIEALVAPTTSWAQDALASIAAGLKRGLSPGFTVPAGGDRVVRAAGALIRRVHQADLHELSLVTAPAYAEAQIAARSWVCPPERLMILRDRWRR